MLEFSSIGNCSVGCNEDLFFIRHMRWMFMGKIVAVMCSPEDNDSSSRIADAFLDGAMGLSTNLIDFYRLSKLRSIQDCCCKPAAFKDKRVIYDDLLPILEDIRVPIASFSPHPSILGVRAVSTRYSRTG